MLLAGMRALKDAGMDVVKLGVDAENPSGALRLYENVGFEVVYTNVAYAKDI
jgi:ribosomal protein S18 acetylase RimI-like enzyme